MVSDSLLLFNLTDQNSSKIIEMDVNGTIKDSIVVPYAKLTKICKLPDSKFVVFSSDSVFTISHTGIPLNQKKFSNSVRDLINYGDTLVMITSDSIFKLTENLTIVSHTGFAGNQNFVKIKSDNSRIYLLNNDSLASNLICLDKNLNFQSTKIFHHSVLNDPKFDFNNQHFAISYNYKMAEQYSVRHLEYSLDKIEDNDINMTDIGLIDFQIKNLLVHNSYPQDTNFANVFYVSFDLDFAIKNYGNKSLNSFRLNHFIWWDICSEIYYSNEFTNFSLASGDSMWFHINGFHSLNDYFAGDTIQRNICAFTSHPNTKTDLNISNDRFCKNIVFGYKGIDEADKMDFKIFPNPSQAMLYFETLNSGNYDFELYDMLGNILKKGIIVNNRIDISNLNNGAYLLRIKNSEKGKSSVVKVMKI